MFRERIGCLLNACKSYILGLSFLGGLLLGTEYMKLCDCSGSLAILISVTITFGSTFLLLKGMMKLLCVDD